MFSDIDFTYMQRALTLAAHGLYTTTPNPRVGCVLVKDEHIIGEGYTQPAGQDHAEVRALKDALSRGNDPRGATAYVSLEPCSHFGRTPPCADALVRAGFASPVLDVERYTLNYLDVRRVAADLKATGARNATLGRSRGLTGRGRFIALQSAYESFRQNGRLPATYEVVFGHAWVTGASARLGAPGESAAAADTHVSLEDIKQQLRSRRRS